MMEDGEGKGSCVCVCVCVKKCAKTFTITMCHVVQD